MQCFEVFIGGQVEQDPAGMILQDPVDRRGQFIPPEFIQVALVPNLQPGAHLQSVRINEVQGAQDTVEA